MPRILAFTALLVAVAACAAGDSTDATNQRSVSGTGNTFVVPAQ